jgi:hypothetical protein
MGTPTTTLDPLDICEASSSDEISESHFSDRECGPTVRKQSRNLILCVPPAREVEAKFRRMEAGVRQLKVLLRTARNLERERFGNERVTPEGHRR